MFKQTSMTGVGMLSLILVNLMQWIGIVDFSETQATEVIGAAIQVVSFGLMVWGQIRRSDLSLGIFRK